MADKSSVFSMVVLVFFGIIAMGRASLSRQAGFSLERVTSSNWTSDYLTSSIQDEVSAIECANTCLANDHCNSFHLEKSTRTCTLGQVDYLESPAPSEGTSTAVLVELDPIVRRACTPQNQCSHEQGLCNSTGDCSAGFECSPGDDNQCMDVDECPEGCPDPESECTNSLGGFSCDCMSGYEGDPYNDCTDIDECLGSVCPSNTDCLNSPGSFSCVCSVGYEGDPDVGCTDIDECSSPHPFTCGSNAWCNNLDGSYACVCNNGYEGNADFGCTDYNECGQLPPLCVDPTRFCINLEATYSCIDPTEVPGTNVGGGGGSAFTDKTYFDTHGYVTGVEIRVGAWMDAIRTRYGNFWAPWRGGGGGSLAWFYITPGEFIEKIEGVASYYVTKNQGNDSDRISVYSGGVVNGLMFYGKDGASGGSTGGGGTLTTFEQPGCYFSYLEGRVGGAVDSLKFNFDCPT